MNCVLTMPQERGEQAALMVEHEDVEKAEYEGDCSSRAKIHAVRTRSSRGHGILLATQTVLLVFNLILFAQNFSTTRSDGIADPGRNQNLEEPYTPASSAVRYEISQTDGYDVQSSHFIGEPRLELDQAWSDLLRSVNILISEGEMRKMSKTSVALRDGSGYLGYLEVHHMLHCLKRFKQFRHLEHYPELDLVTFDHHHWDHCIEVIRRGIMCNADLMIDTLVWKDNGTGLQGVNHWPRKCANWDSIQAFADSRAVEVDHSDPLANFWSSDEEQSVGPADLLP